MAEEPLRQLLAENIRRYAEQRGVPLNTMADLAGVSRSQLYSVLAGEKAATIDWIARVSKVLKVPAWKLLAPEGNPLPTS